MAEGDDAHEVDNALLIREAGKDLDEGGHTAVICETETAEDHVVEGMDPLGAPHHEVVGLEDAQDTSHRSRTQRMNMFKKKARAAKASKIRDNWQVVEFC